MIEATEVREILYILLFISIGFIKFSIDADKNPVIDAVYFLISCTIAGITAHGLWG